MVVFTICFLGLVAYLKDSTKADPALSFYGRSSEDKGGLKVLFSHSFYDFSLYLTMLGKKKKQLTTDSSYRAGVSGYMGGGPSFPSLTGLRPRRTV